MNEDLEKEEAKMPEDTKPVKIASDSKEKIKGVTSNDSKIIIAIVVSVIVIALAIFGYFLYNKSFKAAIKFDGGYVSASDFEIYYRTFAPMLEQYGYSDSIIPQVIAEKAASDKIIVTRAKKAGIKISAEDKAYVDEIFADQEQIEMFKNVGIDPARMKQFYYNDYIMDDYIEYLQGELSDEEVKTYILDTYGEDTDMREYVTNHILFATIDTSTYLELSDEEKAKVKQTAEEVLKRALAGEDFAALAKEYSDDTATKDNSGEYKLYMDNNTVKAFSDATVTLKDGEIFPTLVETEYGYHIIKLVKYNEEGRVHSDTERQAIVRERLNNLNDELNVTINEDVMNETIRAIKGITSDDEADIYSEEEDTHDHTDDVNSDVVVEQ